MSKLNSDQLSFRSYSCLLQIIYSRDAMTGYQDTGIRDFATTQVNSSPVSTAPAASSLTEPNIQPGYEGRLSSLGSNPYERRRQAIRGQHSYSRRLAAPSPLRHSSFVEQNLETTPQTGPESPQFRFPPLREYSSTLGEQAGTNMVSQVSLQLVLSAFRNFVCILPSHFGTSFETIASLRLGVLGTSPCQF